MGNHSSRSGEGRPAMNVLPSFRAYGGVHFDGHTNLSSLPFGIFHLASNRSPPNQIVKPVSIIVEFVSQAFWSAKFHSRRANRFVCLLGAFYFTLVSSRLVGKKVRPKKLRNLRSRGLECLLGKRVRIGTHVGNETVFIKSLGYPHGSLGSKSQFATAFLLQGRSDKCCLRFLGERSLDNIGNLNRLILNELPQGGGSFFIQENNIVLASVLRKLSGEPIKITGHRNATTSNFCQQTIHTQPRSGLC